MKNNHTPQSKIYCLKKNLLGMTALALLGTISLRGVQDKDPKQLSSPKEDLLSYEIAPKKKAETEEMGNWPKDSFFKEHLMKVIILGVVSAICIRSDDTPKKSSKILGENFLRELSESHTPFQEALIKAIERKGSDQNLLEWLIKKEGLVDINHISGIKKDKTALLTALKLKRNAPLIRWLLEKGADPKQGKKPGESALTPALEQGYADTVIQALIDLLDANEALLEVIRYFGRPSVYKKNKQRCKHIIQYVQRKSIEVDYKSNDKGVFELILEGKYPIAFIKWMLSSENRNIIQKDKKITEKLFEAVLKKEDPVAWVKWLRAQRTIAFSEEDSRLPLRVIDSFRNGFSFSEVHENSHWKVKRIIDEQKCKDLIIFFQKEEAIDINTAFFVNETALTLAVERRYSEEFIEWLIEEAKADKKPNRLGKTAVHEALEQKYSEEFIEKLLKKGVPIDSTLWGKTAIRVALMYKYSEPFIRKILKKMQGKAHSKLKKLFDKDTVQLALSHTYSEEFIKWLIKKGALLANSDLNGELVLGLAIKGKYSVGLVKWLIKVMKPTKALWQLISFFGSESSGEYQARAKELITYVKGQGNIDINAPVFYGQTILTLALNTGCSVDFIQWLVKQGADLTCKNKGGQTTTDLAFKKEYPQAFVQKLIAKGIVLSNDRSGNVMTTLRQALERKLGLTFFQSLINQEEFDVNKGSRRSSDTPILEVINHFGVSDKKDKKIDKCKKIISFLCAKGADMHFMGNRRKGILYQIIQHKYPIDFIKWFIDQKGFDASRGFWSMIYSSRFTPPSKKELEIYEEVIKHLSRKEGFHIHHMEQNETVLSLTIKGECYSENFIKRLINRKGCKVNRALLEMGNIAFPRRESYNKARTKWRAILTYLKNKKEADINSLRGDGHTVLTLALQNKHPVDSIKYLLTLGANPNLNEVVKIYTLDGAFCNGGRNEERILALIELGKFDLDATFPDTAHSKVLEVLCAQPYNRAIRAFCVRCKEEDSRRYDEKLVSGYARSYNVSLPKELESMIRLSFLVGEYGYESFNRRLKANDGVLSFSAWKEDNKNKESPELSIEIAQFYMKHYP